MSSVPVLPKVRLRRGGTTSVSTQPVEVAKKVTLLEQSQRLMTPGFCLLEMIEISVIHLNFFLLLC